MSDEPTPPADAPVDTAPPAPPEAAPGSIETPAPVAPQLGGEQPSAPAPTPPADAPAGSAPPGADSQAPTPQPALPVTAFGENGQPVPALAPTEKKGAYVDAKGVKHEVVIVAEHDDGSVDVMLPATVGGYRRDRIRRRASEEQTADYLV